MEKKNNKIDLTAIILTYNEEIHIERCIKSIRKFVKDIIIVDSFSNDKTLEICKKYKDNIRIYQSKFINHSHQLNKILKKIKINTSWLIRLDSDEFVEKDFYKKIIKIKNLENYNGINMVIEHNFIGNRVKYGGVYPQLQIRMWKKNSGYFDNKPVDEKIKLKRPNIYNSNLRIIDDNLKGIKFWFIKHLRYAKNEAKLYDLIVKKKIKIDGNNKKFLQKIFYYKFPIFLRPIILFIYRLFVKKGILGGLSGIKFLLFQTLLYRLMADFFIFKNLLLNK